MSIQSVTRTSHKTRYRQHDILIYDTGSKQIKNGSDKSGASDYNDIMWYRIKRPLLYYITTLHYACVSYAIARIPVVEYSIIKTIHVYRLTVRPVHSHDDALCKRWHFSADAWRTHFWADRDAGPLQRCARAIAWPAPMDHLRGRVRGAANTAEHKKNTCDSNSGANTPRYATNGGGGNAAGKQHTHDAARRTWTRTH